MRPPRDDIAIPPLPRDLSWIGAEVGLSAERLAAKGPVLVHFFDFAQLNGVRTLPYVRRWDERYAELGVTVLGVDSPRFAGLASADALRSGIARLEIPYPVALDVNHRVWRAYGCRGWPSLFLWGRGGVLRWFHFGEGEYRDTEEAIQELVLESRPGARLPSPLEPLRPTDATGALVMPPTEEVLPGGSASHPWRATPDAPVLELEYAAGAAFATADGDGRLAVELDGRTLEPIAVAAPRLYELATHERHGEHRVALRPDGPVRVWSVSFAAGVP
jgi:AhpC/TSA family